MLSFGLTVLLDGVSYGMILFLISVGLTVTMGLMRSSISRTAPSR
jgi:branched-chain amino acid transport system permease protein